MCSRVRARGIDAVTPSTVQRTRLVDIRDQTKEIKVAAESANECVDASRVVGCLDTAQKTLKIASQRMRSTQRTSARASCVQLLCESFVHLLMYHVWPSAPSLLAPQLLYLAD